MNRDEKVKFLCEHFNKNESDYEGMDDGMIDTLYSIAYYGD